MRKMKGLICLIVLSLLAFGDVGFAKGNQIDFVEFDLENGLHVILYQDATVPMVDVAVMYHVGSKNEKPNRTGFAHFFEHLMFEGTKHIPRGEYSKYVERAGGKLNANTSNDRTFYYEILPTNQLELGLWLESERMLHAKVDSIGIATQKGVVIEEKKQTVDSRPYGTLMQETMKRAFKKHPYKWMTIGDPEHIAAAKDEEFETFYKEFYVPNNAVLVVAGDIDIQETKSLVEKYFQDIPRRAAPIYRPSVVEPPLNGEIRDTIFDNIQLPLILQAYRTPALGTPDYYALSMLSSLLSEGHSSRLQKSLVDEQQKALQTGAFSLPFTDPSVFMSYVLPNMGVECDVLEAAMDAEIAKVRNELISEREYQKLKNQFESKMIRSNLSLEGIVERLATNYTYFKDANRVNTELEKYMQVTREDIKRVANKYLQKDNRIVLYYLPKS